MINKETIIKSLIILFFIIIGSTILVRSLTSGQTLSEYAIENNIPEHAEDVGNTENE